MSTGVAHSARRLMDGLLVAAGFVTGVRSADGMLMREGGPAPLVDGCTLFCRPSSCGEGKPESVGCRMTWDL